jgi:hypothetical protein
MAAIDWTDPCARAAALRSAYFELMSGTRESSFTYLANGVQRTAEYSKGNLDMLAAELQKAEAECSAKINGTAPRRRQAIQFG